jgi:hypothetical protein
MERDEAGESASGGAFEKVKLLGLKVLGEPDKNAINNEQFLRDLKELKNLRSFLIKEAASLELQDLSVLAFGGLNLLRFVASVLRS